MAGKGIGKQISHDKIRSSAANALRRNGIGAMSVHDVMREAGFTVGGFYAHYKSRSEMVEDAFDAAVSDRSEKVGALLDGKDGGECLLEFIASYLSDEHVDNSGTACPWASSLSDLQRASASMKRIATDRFEGAVASLRSDRRAAIATLALAFSSLILMRTVTDATLREEIAAAARFAVERMNNETSGCGPASSAPGAEVGGAEGAGKGDYE